MRIRLTFTCEVEESEGLIEELDLESMQRTIESAIDSYSESMPENAELKQEEVKV